MSSLWAAALVSIGTLTACSPATETSIRVEVSYDPSWGLTSFTLAVAIDGEPARSITTTAAEELLILVPDDWANRAVAIELDALRGDQRYAHGATSATPTRGAEVAAAMSLALLPCGAWCSEGAMECAAGGVSICEQRDSDACLEWSEPVACPDDAPFCSLGTCSDTCVDECAAGETRCEGTDALRACGQAEGDADECLDWLPAVACGSDEICSADQCNTSCSDECVDGTVACSGAGTHTCGDLDANDCLEWGPVVPCEDGESCSGNACAAGCSDDCTIAACDDDSFVDCGQYDLDDCLDWSPGTSCAATDPCSKGACTLDGCISTPLVCDDPPVPICVSGGTIARSYAAAGTCSDGLCEYSFTEVFCPGGCLDGACGCAEATCAIVNVATGQSSAESVAVDDTHVYWTTNVGDTVKRRSKTLAAVETVATGQDGASGMAIDDTHVYWASTNDNTVMRRSKALGAAAVETVASGQDGARGVALDDTHVYWTNIGGDTVMRRSKALGAAAVETVATGQDRAYNVAVDDTHVYWTCQTANGRVMRRSKALGAAAVETVATGQVWAEGVAVDGDHVYWTSADSEGTVMRRSKVLGAVEIVATDQYLPAGVAVDDTHVYWTTLGGGTVNRRAKGLGPIAAETLVTGQDGAARVVVDSSHVYWTTRDDNTVARLSRCACDL